MIRKTFLSSVAITLLAAILAVGLFVTGSAGHAHAYTVVHVIEHSNNDVLVDIGPHGDSMGDLLTFADPLYNAANTKQVGHDSGNCIRTIVGRLYECNWTIFLKYGQITVEGPYYDNADSVLAIIGGTGIYKLARGQMKMHARDKAGTEYDYVYYLSY